MLRFLTSGESHGQALIGLIESFPAGVKISLPGINRHLHRRQQGYGRGARMRIETDRATVLTGVRNGYTLGSPIAIRITNRDWRNWKKIMDPFKPVAKKLSDRQHRLAHDVTKPRPGHADLAGAIKYHTYDLRNILERASARETATRVACGAVARQLLEYFDIRIASHVISIGKASLRKKVSFDTIEKDADTSPVRCVDHNAEKRMIDQIKLARRNRDTVGGVFEVRATGLPVGLGDHAQWFHRLDAALAQAIMSIQSVKGVEIGDGFAAAHLPGSKVHDEIQPDNTDDAIRRKHFGRKSNVAGGVEGGISNGEEIIVRGACKPISTLMQPLNTVDIVNREKAEAMVERSDICVVPAAAIVGEAMVAMVLASAFTDKFGHDSITDIEDNFNAFVHRMF